MKICFASDLHGSETHYAQLLQLLQRERPAVLLLGGDQCHTRIGWDALDQQQSWLHTKFRRFLEQVRPICKVYWTSGNHDLAGSLLAVEELQRQELVIDCNGHWVTLDRDWALCGFPFGPVSSWPYKDWERLDVEQSIQSEESAISYLSQNGTLEQVRTGDFVWSSPTLASLLHGLRKPSDSRFTLIVAHYPPHGGMLDKGAFGKSLGSRALRNFLLASEFDLVCSGHVHEAPYLTGSWVESTGRALCANPGQWGEALHALLFDTADIRGTMTHTVFGQLGKGQVPHYSVRAMRRELKQRWSSSEAPRKPAHRRLVQALFSLRATDKDDLRPPDSQ